MQRFGAAMDASPDGIYLIDREMMSFLHVNEAACRMHQLTRDEVMALKPWEILHGSREALEGVYDDLIASGEFSEPQELLWPRAKGTPIWLEVRRHAQCIGGRWTLVVLTRDVTARKEAESRIAYLTRVYAVLSGINTLIIRVRDRQVLFQEACRIAVEQGKLGMAWIAMVDTEQDKLVPVASAGMTEEFRAAVSARLDAQTLTDPRDSMPDRVIADGKAFVTNDSQNDSRMSLSDWHVNLGIHSMAIFPLKASGKPFGVMTLYAREAGFFHEEELVLLNELAGDVAYAVEHIEKQERLDYLAYYDELTGLANRRLFIERLGQYVRSCTEGDRKLAVCLLDIERFRNINDSLGRAAGDSLLRQVAQWITADVGDVNVVARIDTDRFAVVLPVVSGEDAIARRLDRSLKAFLGHSFTLNDSSYRIAAKLGIALYPDDGEDADTLFAHAESALKKAKAGGDRYLFYAQKMSETVAGRLTMENQLRRALELDEYVLHYQPKIDSDSGKMVGAEALIRWNDPMTGLVPPGRFIPILEETGLIHEVGRWALKQALQDHRRWRHAGLPAVRIAVNLSPLQLRHRDFIAEIRQLIAADTCAAAGLELEITESLIMENVQLSIANLKAVRALGVTVAIDDFGTGFSSLSYLSRLPVDTVKIDRSFIMEMVTGPEGLSLVSIIINLAHSLKLGVVAEGVETEEQSRLLRLLNCDEMQGFLFGKPVPAAEFALKYLH
jgi:diguanylate cyclase (GGDEF)-like protein/PAS domain S-box-containing protein